MTTVMRGVIPYISASTLKHAERESPSTEGKELTFLFTDIRGFTTLCEGMEPDKVVELLNHYLDLQSSLIIANEGDVDKYVGDEIMAQFDGPRKEINAVQGGAGDPPRHGGGGAQGIARAAGTVINIGIGINTGQVVHGSVGAKDRMDFTSIGDTVNLAARLEGREQAVRHGVPDHGSGPREGRRDVSLPRGRPDDGEGKELPVRIFEFSGKRRAPPRRTSASRSSSRPPSRLYRNRSGNSAEKGFHRPGQGLRRRGERGFPQAHRAVPQGPAGRRAGTGSSI